MGACVIEKHVTLDRNGGGADDSFSIEPDELALLCRDAKIVKSALGSVNYGSVLSEGSNLKFRRSLYVVENIKKGELISEVNTRSIRPGGGLLPKYFTSVIGKRASKDIDRGTPLDWSLIE